MIFTYSYIFTLQVIDIESTEKSTYVPFYQVYTPRTLHDKAEFYESYTISNTAITWTSSGSSYGRIFKLPLVPKGIFTTDYADITVKITLGRDSTVRNSRDSDPKFILSDGYDNLRYGMGFELRDENSGPHCRGIQGRVGTTLSLRTVAVGTSSSTTALPEQFTMVINPSERWGTCYHGSDAGVISLASYTCPYLALTNGLYLEMYREGTTEHYALNYVIVEIHQNSV